MYYLFADEYTLIPQDKPLSIFNTLTAHLNTPMPSLKKARRISQLMSMGDPANGGQSHVGGPKSGNNLDGLSEIKLYLNRKVKRVDERDGKIHIKVVCIPSSDRQRQENKILAVAPHALTGDIITHALERFQVKNGYAYDFADEDEPQNVRYKDIPYTLSINVQGQGMTQISLRLSPHAIELTCCHCAFLPQLQRSPQRTKSYQHSEDPFQNCIQRRITAIQKEHQRRQSLQHQRHMKRTSS
jgi:hypothetical protein